MKIAILGPFFLPQLYGIEKVMWNHAKHLAARGHEVHVLTTAQRFPHGDFPNQPVREERDGFMVHRLEVLLRSPSRFQYYLSNSGLLIRGLSSTLRQLAPDIVHVHNVASPAWAHAAARYTEARGRKLFYSPHYHPDAVTMSRWHTLLVHQLNRLPLRVARRLYQLTSLDFSLFEREYPDATRDRSAVLLNGVEPASAIRHRAPEDHRLHLLFVGRVEDHRKGFDVLERAFAATRQSHWVLTVVGVIGAAKKAALEGRFGDGIRVLGVVDEAGLEQEYANTDLFVMPSRYEGFGMPYIEAMRYGVPVIGARVGGVPEVVPEGTGLLVDADDEPGLIAAMQQLGGSARERRRFGETGRAWSEHFQWRHVIDGLEHDYHTA